MLEILRGAGTPLHPSAIAKFMLITRGGMTKARGVIEKLDRARRMPHPLDRRMLRVEITATPPRIRQELLH
jgi:DNA-binding MarR family transcriptional regulator